MRAARFECAPGRCRLRQDHDNVFDRRATLFDDMTTSLNETDRAHQAETALIPGLHHGPKSSCTARRTDVLQHSQHKAQAVPLPDQVWMHAYSDI